MMGKLYKKYGILGKDCVIAKVSGRFEARDRICNLYAKLSNLLLIILI